MTAPMSWRPLVRPARFRRAADMALAGLPLVAGAAAPAWRLAGAGAALAVAAIGAVAVLAVAAGAARQIDARWLVRALDAARPDMEDSAGLVFADAPATTPLALLQRSRLEARLAAAAPVDLRGGWHIGRLAIAWAVGLLAVGAALLLPPGAPTATRLAAPETEALSPPGVPRLVGQRLHIVPPAYTGLPARYESSLDAKVLEGSRIEWTLRYAPAPAAVALKFLPAETVPLRLTGADWGAVRGFNRSLLYRILPSGASASRLHRIDVTPDTPPTIRIVTPARSLSLSKPGQRDWVLQFDAADDHAVNAIGQLHIILAQGDGENIKFVEKTLQLRGTGPVAARRFAAQLDLKALGFAPGNDLVAQLIISDNRSPGPQQGASANVILRWPPPSAIEGSGIDGVVKKVLPAYFRSQRQIIIDAEALVKQQRSIPAPKFVARSDGIGGDQALLRMRYAQFLGGEHEEQRNALPTGDGDAAAKPAGDDDPLAGFGHEHDETASEALDPATQATLRLALDQMWDSERELRQGRPQQALPHAYAALRFIKTVQQATRIFLARSGATLPPIDESRRLTGDRKGLEPQRLQLAVQPGDAASAVVTAWRGLAAGPVTAPLLDGLEVWLAANPGRAADPLAIAAAIDDLRRDPGCIACRMALRGQLWTVLARPPAGVARRAGPDAMGRRYLGALDTPQ